MFYIVIAVALHHAYVQTQTKNACQCTPEVSVTRMPLARRWLHSIRSGYIKYHACSTRIARLLESGAHLGAEKIIARRHRGTIALRNNIILCHGTRRSAKTHTLRVRTRMISVYKYGCLAKRKNNKSRTPNNARRRRRWRQRSSTAAHCVYRIRKTRSRDGASTRTTCEPFKTALERANALPFARAMA